MSGDDRITSHGVLRRCFQLEILRRRCSIRSSNEKCTGFGVWPALQLFVTDLGFCFCIVNLDKHGQRQTGDTNRRRTQTRGYLPWRKASSATMPPASRNRLPGSGTPLSLWTGLISTLSNYPSESVPLRCAEITRTLLPPL